MTKLNLLLMLLLAPVFDHQSSPPPRELPAPAVQKLGNSLKAANVHERHLWRDTPPVNNDRTINAYVEIARGDRRKWEFDMKAQARAIDRMIPESVGAYPINYGFVPQTVSYDGDPFDALVLGPPIEGGRLVRGVPVGLLLMEDEKGLDSKVVLSPLDADGRPLHQLTDDVRQEVADYFSRYKQHEPGAFSRVAGWESGEQALELVRLTHAFFTQCRTPAARGCAVL